MPLIRRQQQEEEMRCSFCHKGQSIVSKLISSPSDYPGAYICNECIAVCNKIVIEEKDGVAKDPVEGNPLLDELLDAVEQWVACGRQRQNEEEPLSRMRHIAELMFPGDSPAE